MRFEPVTSSLVAPEAQAWISEAKPYKTALYAKAPGESSLGHRSLLPIACHQLLLGGSYGTKKLEGLSWKAVVTAEPSPYFSKLANGVNIADI